MDKELKAAEVAASDAYYAQNEPYEFSSEESAGSYELERHNGAARAARAARDVILNEWYLTPQGAEEKRLANEAVLEAQKKMAMEQQIAYELGKEKERFYLADLAVRRQAYATKWGYKDWAAYVAYIVPQIRYSYEHPWLAWVICRSDPEPPCNLELFNKYESESGRYR
jgi:enoyl-CoA hydratase/carnithine racemase